MEQEVSVETIGTGSADTSVDVRAGEVFVRQSLRAQAESLGALASIAAEVLGALSGRLFVADYGLRCIRELGADGPVGDEVLLEGTMAGRTFASGEPTKYGDGPTVMWLLLSEGSERIGLLELTFAEREVAPTEDIAEVVRMLVLLLVSGRRYTDVLCRARRVQPLSEAAEAQWDLLPPLSYSGREIAVSGMLEPAYSIGGDSFDYAVNPGQLDMAIIDAVGHGLPAVLMASAAINTLRNARREGRTLEHAYRQVDRRIAEQFGHSFYVTGQIASLDFSNGHLTWVNAGHVLPQLVRNGSLVGELACRPSMPMGLGGAVVEVAVETLQKGDRVLFHTDGVSESRSPDGTPFGSDRLADFLVRATLDRVSGAETIRRLSASIVAHVGAGLRDDATMFLIEYRNDQTLAPESVPVDGGDRK